MWKERGLLKGRMNRLEAEGGKRSAENSRGLEGDLTAGVAKKEQRPLLQEEGG